MKFSEAMKHYEKGERIRATSWSTDYFISQEEWTQNISLSIFDLEEEWKISVKPAPTIMSRIKNKLFKTKEKPGPSEGTC